MSHTQPDAAAEHPPQLLPAAALWRARRDPQEADIGAVQAQGTILLLTLEQNCPAWVTHTLSEHTAWARGTYSWTARAAFISPVCSAELLLPSPLRIESSE